MSGRRANPAELLHRFVVEGAPATPPEPVPVAAPEPEPAPVAEEPPPPPKKAKGKSKSGKAPAGSDLGGQICFRVPLEFHTRLHVTARSKRTTVKAMILEALKKQGFSE